MSFTPIPACIDVLQQQSLNAVYRLLSDICKHPEIKVNKALIQQIPLIKKGLKQQFQQRFHRLMTEEPCHIHRGIIGEVQHQIEELALVDKEEQAFKLASDAFIEKAQVLGGINLALLTIRFEHVTDQQLEDEDLPLGPQQLCQALQEAIRVIELHTEHKVGFFRRVLAMLYKHYNDYLLDANNTFIDQRICEHLDESDGRARFRSKREKVKAAIKRNNLLSSINQNLTLDDEGNPLPPKMDELLEHIHIPPSASEHVLDVNIMAPDASKEELLAAISQLYQSQSDEGYLQPRSELTLAKQLQQNTGLSEFRVGKSNANSISMMSLLFEDLYNNQHIAAAIMALIELLQVPLLKTAILDKNFFADSGNPAQLLLDLVVEQGLSWAPDKVPEKDFLYIKLAQLIAQVNKNFDGSYSVFNQAIHDFNQFYKKHKLRVEMIESRIVTTEKAKARVDRAKQEAQQHTEITFGIYQLPAAVDCFLQQHWQQVLFYIHNKYDNQRNDEWRNALISEKLLMLNFNSHAKADKNKALAAMKKMMLNTGMENADVNTLLKTIIELVGPAAKKIAKAELRSVEKPTSESIDIELTDEQIEQLQNQLTVGSWLIDHRQSEGEKVKIAAYIKHTDTYILVHRNGTKSDSFNSRQIYTQIKQHNFTVLERSLMFDKALESVITAIRAA
ncbi:MAG: DUF1631 family protein [Pseudomonadales bacterium]|nr:DUF1631 family protein [Pseudomonadales bacterium]